MLFPLLLLCGWLLGLGYLKAQSAESEATPPSTSAALNQPSERKAHAAALYSQAARTEMLKGFPDALPAYLQVLEVDPTFIELQVKIGLFFLQNREATRALQHLQQAAASNPRSGAIQAALGYVAYSTGKIEQAVSHARAAVQLEPEHLPAQRLLFEALRDQGKLADAIAHLRTVKTIPSRDPELWLELARTFTELVSSSTRLHPEDFAELIEPLFDNAFAYTQFPSQQLLLSRGLYAQLVERPQEALDYLQRATAVGEPNPHLYVRLAHLRALSGDLDGAIASFEEAYALEPDLPLLREQLAYHYVRGDREEKAIPLLEEILDKAPARSRVYSALGDLYREAGKLSKAEHNYRLAISLSPTTPDEHLKLSHVLMRQGRHEEARATLGEARQRFPQSARVALFEGITHRESGNLAAALDAFAQAKILADQRDPQFPYASYYYELSLAQEKAGKPDLSEATLQQGLLLEPNNENLMNALAYLWAQQKKNLAKAAELSRRSLEIAPERGEYLDTLGWIYFQMGEFQAALPLLERAATITDGNSEVLEHLAETYLKLDRRAEAHQLYRRILDKEPNNQRLRDRFAQVQRDYPWVSNTPPAEGNPPLASE